MRALTLTAAALSGLLVAAAILFMVRSDPLGGEPFALLQIDSATRPDGTPGLSVARNREFQPPAAEQPAGTPEPERQPGDGAQSPREQRVAIVAAGKSRAAEMARSVLENQ